MPVFLRDRGRAFLIEKSNRVVKDGSRFLLGYGFLLQGGAPDCIFHYRINFNPTPFTLPGWEIRWEFDFSPNKKGATFLT